MAGHNLLADNLALKGRDAAFQFLRPGGFVDHSALLTHKQPTSP
jgi:hypothetical protein